MKANKYGIENLMVLQTIPWYQDRNLDKNSFDNQKIIINI
jgi:hypothetical protein